MRRIETGVRHLAGLGWDDLKDYLMSDASHTLMVQSEDPLKILSLTIMRQLTAPSCPVYVRFKTADLAS